MSHDAAVARAYAYCEQLARQHYENFPVASRLLPVAMRPHVAAIYAFARTADDYADEPGLAPGERLRLLDAWGERLACSAERQFGAPRGGTEVPPYGCGVSADAIFLALGQTIRDCRLPVALFEDLLSAFRQDVTTTRYQTWAGVLDYCRRSANPVGRLVLRVAGYDDARLDQQRSRGGHNVENGLPRRDDIARISNGNRQDASVSRRPDLGAAECCFGSSELWLKLRQRSIDVRQL